jgi:hypothetical protein
MKELHGTVDEMARQSAENQAEYFRRRPMPDFSSNAAGAVGPVQEDAPLPAGDLGALDQALAAQTDLYRSMGYRNSEPAAPEEQRVATHSLTPSSEPKDATSTFTRSQRGTASGARARGPRSHGPTLARDKTSAGSISRLPHASAAPPSHGSTKVDAPQMPSPLDAILARPAILPGQEADQFHELHQQIRQSLIAAKSLPAGSSDPLMEMWAYDITSAFWDVTNLRRMKTELMRRSARGSLATVLRGYVSGSAAQRRGLWGTVRPRKEAREALQAAQLTIESVHAQSFSDNLDLFRTLDTMIAQAERRRNTAIRELDRHDAADARRLLEIARTIDAELNEAEAKQESDRQESSANP